MAPIHTAEKSGFQHFLSYVILPKKSKSKIQFSEKKKKKIKIFFFFLAKIAQNPNSNHSVLHNSNQQERREPTWGYLLLGSTWLSMARTKAAVFPVPDCDWAMRFCGLRETRHRDNECFYVNWVNFNRKWSYSFTRKTVLISNPEMIPCSTRYTYGSASIMGKAVSWILDGRLKPIPYTPWRSWGLLHRAENGQRSFFKKNK